jgi:hypothetical protein
VDLRRLRAGEWIAGLAGAALVVSLFLPWYGAKGTSATADAWQAFSVNDVILMLTALFGIGLFVMTATQRTAAVPVAVASTTALVALVAIAIVIVRLADPPGAGSITREAGAWLGLVATLGIFAGAFRSMGDERTPRMAAPQIDVTALPPPNPQGDGA